MIRRRDGLIGAAGLLVGGCASTGTSAGAAAPSAPVRTDVPEPAKAPAVTATPAGRVVPLAGSPEGLAVDEQDGIVAVGVRDPDGVALVDAATGAVRTVVRLPGAPRHLELAGPRGPLLVPAEQAATLYQLALPAGGVIAATKVGRQPHDVAAAGGTVFVGNEYSDTVSLVRDGRVTGTVPCPVQPGGVAAAPDGSVVVVVGVRGRHIEAYAADGRPLGTAPCGVGPTHVRAGAGHLFYVADTEGDALLVFEAGADGVRQVGRAATAGGAPYGLDVDTTRGVVYTTLTADNLVQSFRATGSTLAAQRTWPTVRQPNSVAVHHTAAQLVVTGTADGHLQFIPV